MSPPPDGSGLAPRALARSVACNFDSEFKMFAVIKTGGKQYKVAQDQIVEIESLAGDAGTKVSFGEVLLIGGGEGDKVSKVGVPFLSGVTVEGEILGHGRGDKILVVKKKRRQNYRRKNGHRQPFTRVKILSIAA